jgi:hypothetical protein
MKGVVTLVVAAGLAAAAGCGGGGSGGEPALRELVTAGEGRSFITDIARGGEISDWAPAGESARPLARAAWADRHTIEALGEKLAADGPEWACEAAEQIHILHKQQLEVTDQRKELSAAHVESHEDLPTAELDRVIDQASELSTEELKTLLEARCKKVLNSI